MSKMKRREFLKKGALTVAGGAVALTVAKVATDDVSEDPAPYAQSTGEVLHPYFLDKGWKQTFLENDLEICIFDPARCKWLSLMTIRADDLDTKRAIWQI